MTAPLLSFIVPAYNASGTLAETLRSALSQRVREIEVIVVNDGSTDSTGAIARSTGDPRVRVLEQGNRGLAGARNTGLLAARGRLVSFLDADDLVDEEYARCMLDATAHADASACAYRLIGAAGEDLDWTIRPTLHDLRPERLIQGNRIACTIAARLDTLHRAIPGREIFREDLGVLEDWELWLRLTGVGVRWATPVAAPILSVRLRRESLSTSVERMYKAGLRVIDAAPVHDELKGPATRRWVVHHAAGFVASGDSASARSLLESVPAFGAHDAAEFAAAFGPAKQKRETIGPRGARARHAAWRTLLGCALSGTAWREACLAHFDRLHRDWGKAAAQLALALGPLDMPVVYGMGWNGREAIESLARTLPGRTIGWIDDAAEASPPADIAPRTVRLRPLELGERHLVLVTPSDGSGIVETLLRMGVRIAA